MAKPNKDNLSHSASKVAAIVVLYHPDWAILRPLLNRLAGQADCILMIDNTPPGDHLELNISIAQFEFGEVHYRALGDNLGIAYAQNVGIKIAEQFSCDHVFLLDQDSEISNTIIQDLIEAERGLINGGQNPAVVGPAFVDRKTGQLAQIIRHGYFFVKRLNILDQDVAPMWADYLISSGSLIRMEVLKVTGGMRNNLFIDWVDIEWGLRAASMGFISYVIPTVRMRHDIGDAVVRFMGRNINIHDDLRNYYIVRNACHLLLDPQVKLSWKVSICLKVPSWIFLYSVTSLSKQRLKAFLRLLLGCLHGFIGRLGRYESPFKT